MDGVGVGLLSLPVELLQLLSSYLPLRAVLSLSQTCHHLRYALNDNSVWGRFLSEGTLTLESLEPQVKPVSNLGLDLNSLCENKLHCARNIHLLNNWRTASYLGFTTKTRYAYSSCVRNIPKGKGQLIYKNRYLFLGRFMDDVHSDGIEVWDIKKKPVLHSVLKIEDLDYDSFYVIGNKLVVIYCINVNVYKIIIPEKGFPVEYSFIITGNCVAPTQNVFHVGVHDTMCVGWSHSVTGQYLISNKCGYGEDEGNIFHIWDIENDLKVGSFRTPWEGFSVTVQSFTRKNLVLNQSIWCSRYHYFFYFNIEDKAFSESVFKFSGFLRHIIFYESYVIVFDSADERDPEGWRDTVCTVYDFSTSVALKKRRFNNARKNSNLEITTVVNGTFILLCNDCFQVIDATTLKTVDQFQSEIEDNFIIHFLLLCGSVFVITETDHSYNIWDIEEKKKKKVAKKASEVYACRLYFNELKTSLVGVGNYKIRVLHFW